MFEAMLLVTFMLSLAIFVVSILRGNFLHPTNFLFLFLVLPVYLSSLRLSSLQAAKWAANTQMTLFVAIVLLCYTPLAIYVANIGRSEVRLSTQRYTPNTKSIRNLASILSLLYILCFLGENVWLTKTLFPFLYGIDIHTHSTPLLSIITRDPMIPVSMLALSYSVVRGGRLKRYGELFAIFSIIILPMVARGARYDSVLALATALIVLYFFRYRNRRGRSRFILYVLVGVIALGSLMYVGEIRMTHRGQYTISYAKAIGYKGTLGPQEVFAIYYGYFPMSVENLDLFIRNFDRENAQHTYFIHSLDFLFRGIFNLDNLMGNSWVFEREFASLRSYWVGAATVPTALSKFYMDLGVFAAITPFILLCLALYYYYKGFRKPEYFLLYTMTIVPFILICFTNLISTRTTFINILFWYVVFPLIRKAPGDTIKSCG